MVLGSYLVADVRGLPLHLFNGVTRTPLVASICFLAVALGAILGVATEPSLAATADATASATLLGSSLRVEAPLGAGTFSGTLDGSSHLLEGSGFTGFTVTDGRGTGSGWQVTMKATPFQNITRPGTQFAPDSLQVPVFAVTKADPGSSEVPGTIRSASIDNENGAVIASCTAAGQGMGTYEFSADPGDWKLSVAASEYAGTYTSVITVTVSPLAL